MNRLLVVLLIWCLSVGQAWSQADLLPNAKQTFIDEAGNPLSGGKVYFYVPGSTNKKTTWTNSTETSNNTNPVILDSAGRAVIYGQGNYRQVVQKSSGVQVWDALTTGGDTTPTGATGTDTAPVGTMMPFSGFTLPTNWELAYGQAVSRSSSSYTDLYAALTISDTAVTCTATSQTLTGFASTAQMRIGAPIEATCIPSGTTIASVTNSSTITVNNAAVSSGTVATRVFPWGNGNGSTTFNVPDMRGRVPAGADALSVTSANLLQQSTTLTTVTGALTVVVANATNLFSGMTVIATNVPSGSTVTALSGTTLTLSAVATGSAGGTSATFQAFAGANAPGASGGAASHQQTVAEMPSHNHNLTDPGHFHQQTVSPGGGTHTPTSQPATNGDSTPSGLTTMSATTGVSLANSGGGSFFQTIQPTITVNYIIKVRPNTSGLGGVISLGGMFGDIICDGSFLCANQAIGLATQLTGTVLANIAATTLSPTGVTFTQWMDYVCSSAQGALVYRAASTWTCLGPGTAGQALETQGAGANPIWATIPGTGTVSSVALTANNAFTVTGSPITTAGTLGLDFVTENQNLFLAGPLTGSAAKPTFRALSGVDMPLPGSSSLGAVNSLTATTSNFLTGLSQNGNFTRAQPSFTDVTGVLPLSQGGTNASLVADNGGVVYSNASALTILTHTATANKPLLSGASTTPSWASITYPTSATSGGVAYFSSSTVMASSAALTANQLVIGGGAGVAPVTLGSLGTTTTVLHGNAGGAPTFGAVSLTADVSGILPMINGGTNAALVADNGGIVYSSASALTILTHSATASFPLLSGASTTPSWATIQYPSSGTSGGVVFFSSATALSTSVALGANQLVIGGGAGIGPSTFACATTTTLLHGGTPPTCSQLVNGDITTNTIANQKLAQAAAVTLKGNPSNALTDVQDFTINGLTNQASPDSSLDFLLLWDHTAGTFKKVTPGAIAGSVVAGVSSINTLTGALLLTGTTGSVVTSSATNLTITTDIASATQVQSATANKILDSAVATSAAAPFTLTAGATVTPDLNTGFNFLLTPDRPTTLANPSNISGKEGRSFCLKTTQAATAWTITWGSSYYAAGGSSTATLSTGSGNEDMFCFLIWTNTKIFLLPSKNFSH